MSPYRSLQTVPAWLLSRRHQQHQQLLLNTQLDHGQCQLALHQLTYSSLPVEAEAAVRMVAVMTQVLVEAEALLWLLVLLSLRGNQSQFSLVKVGEAHTAATVSMVDVRNSPHFLQLAAVVVADVPSALVAADLVAELTAVPPAVVQHNLLPAHLLTEQISRHTDAPAGYQRAALKAAVVVAVAQRKLALQVLESEIRDQAAALAELVVKESQTHSAPIHQSFMDLVAVVRGIG